MQVLFMGSLIGDHDLKYNVSVVNMLHVASYALPVMS